jgi:hypothetical protein
MPWLEYGVGFSPGSGLGRLIAKLDMKKLHLGVQPTADARLAPAAHEKRDLLQHASLDLSPERISAGATAKTDVLNEILSRETRAGFSRHWGINE